MNQDWCTIESDPGVFTELISNLGVKDVQVDEVIDLDLLNPEDNVYGVIFLFKYMSKTNYKPNVLGNYDKNLYFAKQVIVNACATQAILAILFNNDKVIDIGPTLSELKSFTSEMDPALKGLCFAECEKVKEEHNKFSKPSQFIETKEKRAAKDGDDVFHFVSYILYNNSIYEIDGLQDGPILIKENVDKHFWVHQLKSSIMERINLYAENEIKFNLMYVTDCKVSKLQKELDLINSQIANSANENSYNLYNQKETIEMMLDEEKRKRQEAKEENVRRQHNYIPLIFEMLKYMSEKGELEKVYNKVVDDLKKDKK